MRCRAGPSLYLRPSCRVVINFNKPYESICTMRIHFQKGISTLLLVYVHILYRFPSYMQVSVPHMMSSTHVFVFFLVRHFNDMFEIRFLGFDNVIQKLFLFVHRL